MPVISYLAYPEKQHRADLLAELSAHPYCEVIPAENADVFIVVTDTPDRKTDETVRNYLEQHHGLLCLAMIHGQVEDPQEQEPNDDTLST